MMMLLGCYFFYFYFIYKKNLEKFYNKQKTTILNLPENRDGDIIISFTTKLFQNC